MARRTSSRGPAAAAFVEAARSGHSSLDPAATDLEGYLFPETYSVPRDTTAAKLVGLMWPFQTALHT
jgi:cell division protein YceG involved in septum cleavage